MQYEIQQQCGRTFVSRAKAADYKVSPYNIFAVLSGAASVVLLTARPDAARRKYSLHSDIVLFVDVV